MSEIERAIHREHEAAYYAALEAAHAKWLEAKHRRAFFGIPPMPTGFTDQAAWDAIHWRFSGGSMLDQAVAGWQRDNQERVAAAARAAADAEHLAST